MKKSSLGSLFALLLVTLGMTGVASTCAADETAEPAKAGESIVNTIGIKMTYIPAGEFEMGNGALFDSLPRHHVKITKAFLMSTTEISQAQWKKIMGMNLSEYKGDSLPVDNVSWDDAVQFCKMLGEKDGRTYRLATEAEWEYACHAGTQTEYYTGKGSGALNEAGWYDSNSHDTTHAVGGKKPNAWGLYDMHGNLWEWVADWHGSIKSDPAVDPQGPAKGRERVMCGGSWNHAAWRCRAWDRDKETPDHRDDDIGFRVVCELKSSK